MLYIKYYRSFKKNFIEIIIFKKMYVQKKYYI